ncbi:hypothetical protein B0H11DRAFT_2396431 [Mycena galericulata]|nr:hypothetical protein B0H11DRAFT_2396431 [Mycena galericulata]
MNATGGVEYGTKFPPEIWLRCWSNSTPHYLRRLVLVCRYFRDLCHPLLFEYQRFRSPDPENVDRSNWVPTTQDLHCSVLRLKKLAASTHASSVRSWHFRGSLGFSELAERHPEVFNIYLVEKTYLNVVRKFTTALTVHTNLRTLHLDQFTIDLPFRETISSLTRLEDVSLQSCDIPSRTGPVLCIQTFALLRYASDGSAWYTFCDEPLHLLSPATLRTLTLHHCRDAKAMLSVFADESLVFPDLATLSIKMCPTHISPDPCQTVSLPPRFPEVFQRASPPGDDAHAWPPEEDIARDLVDIACTSCPVLSLSLEAPIGGAVEICSAIANHFPELRNLALAMKEPPAERQWTSLTDDIDEDEASGDESDLSDFEVDERTLELSENGSLESIATFGDPSAIICLSDDSEDDTSFFPDTLLPGHMYCVVLPPAAANSVVPQYEPTSYSTLLDCISADMISLPTTLVSLRVAVTTPDIFYEVRRIAVSLESQHRALLALERQLPLLRELEFEGGTWTCSGETWTEKGTGARVISMVRD